MEKLSELGEQAYAEFEKEFETDIMITVERFKKAAQKVAGKELKRSMRDVLREEMETTAEKHLSGQHNQKRHAWRYGGNATTSSDARRSMIVTPGKQEREEYKKRARQRLGLGEKPERTPGKRKPKVSGTPKGKPVSGALNTSKLPKGKYSDPVKATLDAIDRVHGDGDLPEIPIELTSTGRWQGAYYQNGRGDAIKIAVSRKSSSPMITTAHESGHFLDNKGFKSSRYASETSAEFAAWRDAVNNSRAYQNLRGLGRQSSVRVELPDGSAYTVRPDLSYVRYATTYRELFARSYAQYIAVRSGNPQMLAELAEIRKNTGKQINYTTQWDDDDFAPVATALDDLFVSQGWLE